MSIKRFLSIVALLLVILVCFSSCLKDTDYDNENESIATTSVNQSTTSAKHSNKTTQNPNKTTQNSDSSLSDKTQVINMFLSKGEYLDGSYYIRKHSETEHCLFSYWFTYNPEIDMFNCAVVVTTYALGVQLLDYGSVTFGWGDFENARFYGYHELKDTASIDFDFSASNPRSNMSFGQYEYSVRSNSFKNLTNKNDIDEYAQTCFDWVNQSLNYAQSVLYAYTSSITLW